MIRKLIPHVCIILSLFIITYVILNEFNPSFFSKGFFKVTLLVYSVATIICSAILYALNRRA
jgi:hypothetical protein